VTAAKKERKNSSIAEAMAVAWKILIEVKRKISLTTTQTKAEVRTDNKNS